MNPGYRACDTYTRPKPAPAVRVPAKGSKLEDWQRAGKSPTQRTLAYMRAKGYVCDVVERALGPKMKRDCFGAFDIVCVPVQAGERVVFVQTTGTTGGGNYAARVRKVTECEHLPIILRTCRVIVHGWAKRKAGWVLKELEL